jgi:hypothetical protein
MTIEEAYNVITDMDDIANINEKAYDESMDDLYNYLTDMTETHDDLQAEIKITKDDEVKIKFIQLVHQGL